MPTPDAFTPRERGPASIEELRIVARLGEIDREMSRLVEERRAKSVALCALRNAEDGRPVVPLSHLKPCKRSDRHDG